MTDISRPKFLSKQAVKTIVESKDIDSLQDLRPVMQIVSIKNVKNKKNMKDKLTISDGAHKLLCIVKDKINTSAEGEYSLYDVIRVNKFQIKVVGKVKIVIPNEDFDVVAREGDDYVPPRITNFYAEVENGNDLAFHVNLTDDNLVKVGVNLEEFSPLSQDLGKSTRLNMESDGNYYGVISNVEKSATYVVDIDAKDVTKRKNAARIRS